VFGFLGPNGAGKTTSLKMLLGLVEPTAGRGTVLGRPLGNRPARAQLGFLPEHFRFHDWLTGRELLHFHGRLYGMPAARITARAEELLARVDLIDAAHRKLREYSKGMLQRIGLAQALMNDPALVFLDEPTSGLDPIGRLLVRDIIRELKARGTSVFLNSHLLGEVEATCDRVVFVKQGRSIHELELAAAGESLAVELELGGADAETLAGLASLARPGGPFEHVNGVVRLEVANEETLPALAQLVVGRGARLYRMSAARKSLETWFLEVMGEDQRPG
jgi:ABC-2 type transport system ATP-binding protein